MRGLLIETFGVVARTAGNNVVVTGMVVRLIIDGALIEVQEIELVAVRIVAGWDSSVRLAAAGRFTGNDATCRPRRKQVTVVGDPTSGRPDRPVPRPTGRHTASGTGRRRTYRGEPYTGIHRPGHAADGRYLGGARSSAGRECG